MATHLLHINPVQSDRQQLLVSFTAETEWLIIINLFLAEAAFSFYSILILMVHLSFNFTYRYVFCPALLFISQRSGQFWRPFEPSCCLCNVFCQCLLLCNAVVIGCLELSNLNKQLKFNDTQVSIMLDPRLLWGQTTSKLPFLPPLPGYPASLLGLP